MNMSKNDSGSESEGEELPLLEPSKKAIYNREGLLECLEEIRWPEDVKWIHKLTIDHVQDQDIDVNDDITREMAFYTQALEGVRQAYAKVEKMGGIPFFRPADYYAEMVKSDSHMLRIKSRILQDKKQIVEADERKKSREAKKISKQVQSQKLKERAKSKKDDIESVKKWRKQRQQSGYAPGKDEELLNSMLESGTATATGKKRPGVAPGDRTGGISKRGAKFGKGIPNSGRPGGGKNREYKDSKFGNGGRKGGRKQNTAETTNDIKGFNRGFKVNKRRKI
ncbi:putative rRNA-processing protein EBP2 [Zostera marina]|uniref:Putative rRNA-processing protein EBP2 n=1 Tax=Zostera marina TaxID=29655 RepID=A0A0K9PUK5_ZOSMR|nr:putative rRNA-processing protein EBP2 [Zostera marina]